MFQNVLKNYECVPTGLEPCTKYEPTCLRGSLLTILDSSDVFETRVLAASMDRALCSQDVVDFFFRRLLLGPALPPILLCIPARELL